MGLVQLPAELRELVADALDSPHELAQLVKVHPVFHRQLNRRLYRENAQDSPYPAIHWAASRGNVATAYRVVQLGLDINQLNEDGFTPLWEAVRCGQARLVELLLNTHKVDFSLRQQGESSPLHAAVLVGKGSAKCARLLLDYDRKVRAELHRSRDDHGDDDGDGDGDLAFLIDVNSSDDRGRTPLSLAIENSKIKALEALLELDDIDMTRLDRNGRSPFMQAIAKSRGTLIQAFINSGKVDLNRAQPGTFCTPLSEAIFKHRVGALRPLLASPEANAHATVRHPGNEEEQRPITLFELACEGRSKEAIQLLLDSSGFDAKAISENNGRTPLHSLVEGRWNAKLITQLLSRDGVDVNAKDFEGYTPLHLACINPNNRQRDHDRGVLAALLEVPGIDVNAEANDGETPLSLALHYNTALEIGLLLSKPGIDINNPVGPKSDPRRKRATPLVLAIQEKQGLTFESLLIHPSFDPVVSLRDRPRHLLHTAIECENPRVLEFLLNHGEEDINELDDLGRVPLSVEEGRSGRSYYFDAAKQYLLTRKELDPCVTDGRGSTPFLDALGPHKTNNGVLLLPDFLAHPRIDPNMTEEHGKPALSIVVTSHNMKKVEAMLAHPRTDVNYTGREPASSSGLTPLHYAVMNADLPSIRQTIVKMLVAHEKIDVNILDSSGHSPLHFAAKNGNCEYVNIILKSGLVDTSRYDPSVSSPLHLAVLHGHEDVVEILLDKGVMDANLKGTDGRSALSIAKKHGQHGVVRLLQRRGATGDKDS